MTMNYAIPQLEWNWFWANPWQWQIQKSDDGLTGWFICDEIGGADRAYAVGDDAWYRICGVGSDYVPNTDVSIPVSAGY